MKWPNSKRTGLSRFKPWPGLSFCITNNVTNIIRCPTLFTVSLSFRRSTVDKHEQSGEDLAGSCHPLDHKRLELDLVCLLSHGQTIATCQRNISQHCWVQHVACVWPPCCDVLRHVGSNLTIFKLEPTTPNMSQHVATWWPNARNMLRPTMLRYVAMACCDRLARALDQTLIP